VYRVFASLDALVTIVEEARGVPMTSTCVVPRGDVLDLLDDVREALPGELDDAQDVLDRRDELVDDATEEAEQTRSSAATDSAELLARARDEADRLVADARAEAEQTLAQARHDAERAIADGRAQYMELTDRARAEAERRTLAGHAAYDRYVQDGQAEQARLVSRSELVQSAHIEAARVVDAATAEADRLRRECDGYVDAKLADFEDTLSKALGTVSRGRSRLWRGPSSNGGSSVPIPDDGGTGTGMDLID
jgi:cell division septum initiation protein DivIVA